MGSMQKFIYPGQPIELNVLEGDYKGTYRSRIEDVNKNLITVLSAFDKSRVVSLRINTEVEVIYYDQMTAYAFNARIVDRISSPVYSYILSLMSKIKRIQRRKFFRVPVFYPISVAKTLPEGLSTPINGIILDLSGGGMKIQLNEPMEVGEIISADLNLPNLKINTTARIVRIDNDEEKKAYILGAEFQDISEPERDRIIRIVFNIQRALLSKGLM